MVVFFFGDHDWLGWTPKQRILFKLRETKQPYSDVATCLLDCYSLSDADVDSILLHGKVLLNESNPQLVPRKYVVQSHEELDNNVKLTFTSSDSLAFLINVNSLNPDISCSCE